MNAEGRTLEARATHIPRGRALRVAILCMLLNLVDGFDLLIVSFVLPNLPRDFATTTEKGFVVSAALVGMAIGAIWLSRFADRYGRKPVVLAGFVLNLAGLLLAAVSANVTMMIGARFITGLGIGVVSVLIVVAAQDAAAPRHRNFATGLVLLGAPLGSVLAALSTNVITSIFGSNWPALYLAGAALAVAGFLGASLAFPASEQAGDDPASAAAPAPGAGTKEKPPPLLGRELLIITVLLCAGFMSVSSVYNFALGLTPDFVKTAMVEGIDPGASPGEVAIATTAARVSGQDVGLWLSVGCLLGALALATIGLAASATTLARIFGVFAVCSMLGFANSFPSSGSAPSPALYIFSITLGIGLFGSIAAYSALVPISFPPLARGKGYGAMFGVGRFGAIIAPPISAFLIGEIGAQRLYNSINVLLICTLACAIALPAVLRAHRRRPVRQDSGGSIAPTVTR